MSDQVKKDAEAMLNMLSSREIRFCRELQQAYEYELSFYKSMIPQLNELEKKRSGLVGGKAAAILYGNDGYYYPLVAGEKVIRQLHELDAKFAEAIIRHIGDARCVHFDGCGAVLPEYPKCSREKGISKLAWKKYNNEVLTLTLHFEDILAWMYRQLDGMTFEERAFAQLTEQCRSAVRSYDKRAMYERNNSVILLNDLFGAMEDRRSGGWYVSGSVQTILRGLSHFETRSLRRIPVSLRVLFDEAGADTKKIVCEDCKKVKEIRLYRNGRVAISFRSPKFAKEFEEAYLCEPAADASKAA